MSYSSGNTAPTKSVIRFTFTAATLETGFGIVAYVYNKKPQNLDMILNPSSDLKFTLVVGDKGLTINQDTVWADKALGKTGLSIEKAQGIATASELSAFAQLATLEAGE